ncbi:MAG: 2-amino-4-hydroxy-6-hydroxymethyldihydropteridine diphosphokinase [Chloroflexota bacterium]
MPTVYLGLGSNMDNPPAQLEAAVATLRILPTTHVQRISPLYMSKAWGKTDQADFLNMVVEIDTALPPASLLREVKQIEAAQGRTRGERWGPRPVDIDILLYDKQEINTPTLLIPHPRMWERAFVLRPLADLAPDLLSSGGTPITALLRQEPLASQVVWPYPSAGVKLKSDS